MSSHVSAQQAETLGRADAARAALSRAVKEASRAHGGRAVVETPVQTALMDFTSLGVEGWKVKGALSLCKQCDGRVSFRIHRRNVARRTRTRDEPLVRLRARCSATGWLTVGKRKGVNAPAMRVRGIMHHAIATGRHAGRAASGPARYGVVAAEFTIDIA
eukprot:6214141-Pleurochrysis_carterae.AAC.10